MLEMTKHVRDGSMNTASMRFRVFCCFIIEGYYSLILFQRVWRLAPHERRKRLHKVGGQSVHMCSLRLRRLIVHTSWGSVRAYVQFAFKAPDCTRPLGAESTHRAT